MLIIFPNPYGYHPSPTTEQVKSLQQQYGFSDQYADFLITQNGFDLDHLKDDIQHQRTYLIASEPQKSDLYYSDFSIFYGLKTQSEYSDLEETLRIWLFAKYFFPIGVDLGGNEFVEILAGKYKGYIASLDHDFYAGYSTLDEVIENLELDNFHYAGLDQQTDILSEQDCGLVWLMAESIQEFFKKCLHCDQDFQSYIEDMTQHTS